MNSSAYRRLPHNKLSALLRANRKKYQLISSNLSKDIGKTRSFISQVENGILRVPRIEFPRFVEFYRINREELAEIDTGFIEVLDRPEDEPEAPQRIDEILLTKEDVQWLLKICDELSKPMTIGQAVDLLKLRH